MTPLFLFWSIPSCQFGTEVELPTSSAHLFMCSILSPRSAMPVIYHSVVPSGFLRTTFWKFSLKCSLDLSLSHFSCLYLFLKKNVLFLSFLCHSKVNYVSFCHHLTSIKDLAFSMFLISFLSTSYYT